MNSITPISGISMPTAIRMDMVQQTSPTAKSFGEFVVSAATDSMNTIKAGETAMINGLSGKTGVQDAVNAILAAETTLQTIMPIRDKAISAYNDILRMPI